MYRSKKWFAEYYQIGLTTVQEIIELIRKTNRYPENSIIRTGKILRIRRDAFEDALRYRDRIECELPVPEFREGIV